MKKEEYKEAQKTQRLFSNEFFESLLAGDCFACLGHELLYVENKLIELGAEYVVTKEVDGFYCIKIKEN